jgi:hypothetical protein
MDSVEGIPTIDRDSLSELSRNVTDTAKVLFMAGSVTDTLASVEPRRI